MAIAKIKRDDVLRLNVAPDIRERLEKLSQVLGMPPSTLAAYAVSWWVAHSERSLAISERMVESVADRLGEEVGDQLKLFLQSVTEKEGVDVKS